MEPKLFNYEIATIAEALYGEIENEETSRSAWAYSLYYVLCKSCGKKPPASPKWEDNYKQWNIDHLYRGALSSKAKKGKIPVCSVISSQKLRNGIKITIGVLGTREMKVDVSISKTLFEDLYAKSLNENRLFILESEVEQIISALGEIGLRENTAAQNCRIDALWRMVKEIRTVYCDAEADDKAFIETVIGAALFYLPHPVNECFNGYCSFDALRNALKDKRIVKEHLFPRKRAGKDVLENNYNRELFYNKVKDEYRTFMYLTSEENKATINYEGTHDEALSRLNIIKFPNITPNPFIKNHTLFKNFINWAKLQVSKNKEIVLEEAEELLNRFLAIRCNDKNS